MSYSSRIMNIPCDDSQMDTSEYKYGHRDARHDAAAIASEAEGEIEYLRGQLRATESLLDKAMTLIPDPEALEYLITLARNAPNLAKNEVALIEHFEKLWEKL